MKSRAGRITCWVRICAKFTYVQAWQLLACAGLCAILMHIYAQYWYARAEVSFTDKHRDARTATNAKIRNAILSGLLEKRLQNISVQRNRSWDGLLITATANQSDQDLVLIKVEPVAMLCPSLPRSRYAYMWILGANGKIRDYAKGIQAAVSLLRNNKADLIHVTSDKDKCTVCSTIVIDYVLMIPDKTPTEQRATFDHLVHSMRPQFDTVVKVPAVGAANYFYADHYLKLLMFGLFENGPLQTRHFYHRVLYLEADYVPLRSLSHLFVHNPTPVLLSQGPNPEWQPVTRDEKRHLALELEEASNFSSGGASCNHMQRQYVPTASIDAQLSINRELRGFIAMPMAYWIPQPCYMAGGPLLIEPSRWLFDKYAVPVTHCDTSRQPKFPH